MQGEIERIRGLILLESYIVAIRRERECSFPSLSFIPLDSIHTRTPADMGAHSFNIPPEAFGLAAHARRHAFLVCLELAAFAPSVVMHGFSDRGMRAWSNGSFSPMSCRRFCEEIGSSMCSLSNQIYAASSVDWILGIQHCKWYGRYGVRSRCLSRLSRVFSENTSNRVEQ